MLENPSEVALLGLCDGPCGKLSMNVIPFDFLERTPDHEDVLFIDEPDELLGKNLRFKVCIIKAYDLPARLANDVYIEFSLKL